MRLKLWQKDLRNQKGITFVLFIFIMLSTLLAASGSSMILELWQSINALFQKSQAPHFVQMHAGGLDQRAIERFTASNPLVKRQQTEEMIKIDGASLYMGNRTDSEARSVMDHYFVQQNVAFDLLLNLQSKPIAVSPGEIAVPIYYMQQSGVGLGDKVRISTAQGELSFTIVDFVRDVQMNPSIIHSKRFVVHPADLKQLKGLEDVGSLEYLIAFQLTDVSHLNAFRTAYEQAGLPQQGPSVDYQLFKTLNAITDGIAAVIVILISVLALIIALLCIRFTILSAMEEDYREIGVMKAIGINAAYIKSVYLSKYTVIASAAAGIGYLVSLGIQPLLAANRKLYMGSAPPSIGSYLVPAAAVILLLLLVILFCRFILRKLDRLSAIEALRAGQIGEAGAKAQRVVLGRSRWLSVPIFLGMHDVRRRFRTYLVLGIVFTICTFMMIVPIHFLNTIQSRDFIQYMGVERSHIRIDLQQADHEAYTKMITRIKQDHDVDRYAAYATSTYQVKLDDGSQENINVQSGDFTTFPMMYLHGSAPRHEGEIALSYLNSKELQKKVGDTIKLQLGEQGKGKVKGKVEGKYEKELLISGIYQDVTNGGRSAKVLLPLDHGTARWYAVSVDLKPAVNKDAKLAEYGMALYPAKVTDLDGYLDQTFGHTIAQLRQLTIVAILLALLVGALITALFLKLAMAKDQKQIAIMKSMGFSLNHLRVQYVTRALLMLSMGIAVGTVLSNTVGEKFASLLLSVLGAPMIQFVINPLEAYILYPLVFIAIVTGTTLMSVLAIKRVTIAKLNGT